MSVCAQIAGGGAECRSWRKESLGLGRGNAKTQQSCKLYSPLLLSSPPRWHHIYLPLLPKQLQDYLTAPMPFMVGMPAQVGWDEAHIHTSMPETSRVAATHTFWLS